MKTMKRVSLLLSVSAIAGLLLGCGNPQPEEQNTEPSTLISQTSHDDSQMATTASSSDKNSPKFENAPIPNVRCGPVYKGSCDEGIYCHIDCCDGHHDSIYTACDGSCQHFGNGVCSSHLGLSAAYWRPWK